MNHKFNKLLPLLFVFSATVNAASMGVWPINPRIDAPDAATLIWVKNNNKTEPVVLQARVLLWNQHNNQEEYLPQDDIVVSPPLIDVKPDAQQIFRVMNRKGPIKDISVEKSYRLLIDEVPKDGGVKGSALRFQMRYSLPLFVGFPDTYANVKMSERLNVMAEALRYRIVQQPAPAIEIINTGKFHARISNMRVNAANNTDKTVVIVPGLLGYVLPGATKSWPIDKVQLAALMSENIKVIFEQEHQELTIAAEK